MQLKNPEKATVDDEYAFVQTAMACSSQPSP